VYKIPPLKVNEGHRAQEWGDLAQPLWKGRMRIVEKSTSAFLIFEDAQSGTNYATSLVSTDQLTGSSGECTHVGRNVRGTDH
jgi:hypothetical protein